MEQKTAESQAKSNGDALKQKLEALLLDDAKRSKTARLWDVYPEVEKALSAGVKQQAVVDVLAEHGLEYTVASFRTVLQRLRGRAKAGRNPPTQSQPPAAARALATKDSARAEVPAAQKNSVEPAAQVAAVSHDPRDLDAIARSTPNLDELAAIGRKRT